MIILLQSLIIIFLLAFLVIIVSYTLQEQSKWSNWSHRTHFVRQDLERIVFVVILFLATVKIADVISKSSVAKTSTSARYPHYG